jgi:hypothetical protein
MKTMNADQVRRRLKILGYRLVKSRVKKININNHGGYMIIEISSNTVISGSKYELTLEDVKRFLRDEGFRTGKMSLE